MDGISNNKAGDSLGITLSAPSSTGLVTPSKVSNTTPTGFGVADSVESESWSEPEFVSSASPSGSWVGSSSSDWGWSFSGWGWLSCSPGSSVSPDWGLFSWAGSSSSSD